MVWPVQLRALPLITPKVSTTSISSNSTFTVPDTDFPYYPPHSFTGVDKLHSEGIEGANINIGVIDTGVDFTHPALGGCFGPGCKIVGGIDLVGDNFTGENIPIEGVFPTIQPAYLSKVALLLTSVRDMVRTLRGLLQQMLGVPMRLSHLSESRQQRQFICIVSLVARG